MTTYGYPRPRRPRRTLEHLFGDEMADEFPAEMLGIRRPRLNFRSDPKTLQDFDTYGLNPAQIREGEPLRQAVRRIDTTNAAMGRPSEGSEYLTNEPLGVNPDTIPPTPVRPPVFIPEMTPPVYTPEVVSPTAASIVGTPPLVVTDSKGRPKRIAVLPGDAVAAEQEYGLAVDQYEPQARGSRLGNFGRGFLRSLRRGEGLIGATIGATEGAINRRVGDEEWKAKETAESAGRLAKYQAQRRGIMQEDLLQSQIEENEAQAAARMRPARPKLVEQVLPDGTSVLVEEAPGIVTGRPKRVEPDIRSGNAPIVERQPDGSYKTIYTPPEKPVEADFSGPLAAKKFAKASEYWDEAMRKEAEARAINTVPDGKNVDVDAENRRDRLLDEAKALKERTRKLQEEGDELETKANRRGADPLKGQKWYKSRYKGPRPIEEAAAAAAARGAIVVP